MAAAIQAITADPAEKAGFPQRVAQAIKAAAAKTGVDFAYLMDKAKVESSLDPNAKAATSSATGLFQFTSQTWLQTLKSHGAKHGLADYADHIEVGKSGVARVSNPVWRDAILNLRKDPKVSAEMAAELDKDNAESLQAKVGGKIGATELYLAHFLGAGGASDFLTAMRANPNAKAANLLPEAASANSSVFFNSDGTARSVGQIYKHFAQKFDSKPASVMVASASAPEPLPAPLPTRSIESFHVASLAEDALSAYSTPVISKLKPEGSSLFATMVLAQMHMGDTGSLSTLEEVERQKKSAIQVLGGVG
ncbi:MAG: transglycosylase SLT domain-containing protein [Alphaproteobacteria bacterium]|nr:transglycosylase SLT domain-containing protein [Alphaproteobacteria bacterium]